MKMIRLLRSIGRFLTVAALLLLAACPQMTTSAVGRGEAPLSATGEKTAISDEAHSGEDLLAAPIGAAPLPSSGMSAPDSGAPAAGDYNTMMRRMDGDVARESSGILSAPSAGERLEDPLYRLRCNVVALQWTTRAARHATCDAFARSLSAGDLELVPVDSRCELMAVAEVVTKDGQITPDQVPDRFRELVPGEYLFFWSSAAPHFPDRVVHDEKGITALEELASLLADATCVGNKSVPVSSPLINVPRDELLPISPGLRESGIIQRQGGFEGLINH